jgi:hypothetical protein
MRRIGFVSQVSRDDASIITQQTFVPHLRRVLGESVGV